MKFDKFMSLSYRILCVILALFIIVGTVCSCTSKALSASAAGEPDPGSIIQIAYDYGQNYIHNMEIVESAIKHDLDTGTIDATSDLARQIVCAALYQKLMTLEDNDLIIQEAGESLLYQQFEENWNNIPDTYQVASDTCSAGYCKDINGGYHYVMFLAKNDIIYLSDLFTIKVNDPENPYNEVKVKEVKRQSGTDRYTVSFADSLSYPHFYDSLGYFDTDVTFTSSKGLWILVQPHANIPTIKPSDGLSYYIHQSSENRPGHIMFGNGGDLGLSSETVNKTSPWSYYNNVMLPYIQEHFPDVYNNYSQYLVFPNGYTPAIPDPTEPPTLPNNGVYIDKNFNIGVNIIYPTNESGQPITDSQGETVTETAYITDTSPVDGEYYFTMPTLPKLTTYDTTIPNPDLSGFSDGFSFIFTAVENIFTRSGFMPVIVACLSLGAVAFILWKIGG